MVDCKDICEGTVDYLGLRVCPFAGQILTWQSNLTLGFLTDDYHLISICEGAYNSKEEFWEAYRKMTSE